MRYLDKLLWNHVARMFTPLGQPSRNDGFAVLMEFLPDSIDLHNMTVEDAHRRTKSFLDAVTKHKKQVRVITGKSGIICREFPLWMEVRDDVRRTVKENGGGSFIVKFK